MRMPASCGASRFLPDKKQTWLARDELIGHDEI